MRESEKWKVSWLELVVPMNCPYKSQKWCWREMFDWALERWSNKLWFFCLPKNHTSFTEVTDLLAGRNCFSLLLRFGLKPALLSIFCGLAFIKESFWLTFQQSSCPFKGEKKSHYDSWVTLAERGSRVSSVVIFAYTTVLPMPVSLSPTFPSLSPPTNFRQIL